MDELGVRVRSGFCFTHKTHFSGVCIAMESLSTFAGEAI